MPATAAPPKTKELTVPKSKLVALFLALGVDTASKWPASKFTDKLKGGIAKFRDDGTRMTDDLERLYDAILTAEDVGTPLAITEEEAAPAAPPVPPKPAPAPRTPAKPATKPSAPAKTTPTRPAPAPAKGEYVRGVPGGWKFGMPPLAFDDRRGPGILKTILDIVKTATTPETAMTKEMIHKKLVAAFPDRDPTRMWTTVVNQVPNRLLSVRGLHLHKRRHDHVTYYWVQGRGTTEQKKVPVTFTPKPELAVEPEPRPDRDKITPPKLRRSKSPIKSSRPAAAK